MHELTVTEGLLEIARRHAQSAGAARITGLYLVVGEWSSIVDDSIQFYWDFVSQGTSAEGASLHFRRVPVEIVCLGCGHQYHPEGDEFACPACRGEQIRIAAGDEFYLEAIDVEPASVPSVGTL